MAFEAGSVVYTVQADTSDLLDSKKKIRDFGSDATKSFKGAGKSASGFGTKLTSVAKGVGIAVGVIATAAAAAGGAVLAMAIQVSNANAQLETLARLSNLSAGDMKAAGFAAKQVGIDMDKMGDIGKDVFERLGAYITEGTGEFDPFLKVIGATKEEGQAMAKEFERLSGPDVLVKMVSKMQAAGASSSQMREALDSMSDSGSLLLPILIDNGAELERLSGKFSEFNESNIVSDEQRENLSAMKENFDLIQGSISGLTTALIADASPEIERFTKIIVENIPRAIDYVRERFITFLNFFRSGEASQTVNTYFGGWIDLFEDVMSGLDVVKQFFGQAFDVIGLDTKGIVDFIKKTFALIPSFIKVILNSAKANFQAFVDQVKAMFKALQFVYDNGFDGTTLRAAMKQLGEDTAEVAKTRKEAHDAMVKQLGDEIDEFDRQKKKLDEIETKTIELTRTTLAGMKAIADEGKKSGGFIFNPVDAVGGEGTASTTGTGTGTKTGTSTSDADKAAEAARKKREAEARRLATEEARAAEERQRASDAASSFSYGIESRGFGELDLIEEENAELKRLLDENLITRSEFNKAKAQLDLEYKMAEAELWKTSLSTLEGATGTMLDVLGNFGDDQSGLYRTMFAVQKGFAAAQAALTLGQNIAQASAIGFPQNLPYIAGAVSQGAQIASIISDATFQGGRRFGGNVVSGGMYEVNESGTPEIYSAGGKDFLMSSENAKITPMSQVGGSGAGEVVINNYSGQTAVASKTDTGWVVDIAKEEAAKARRGAVADVNSDIRSGSGQISKSMKQSMGIQQKAGSGR